MASGDSKNEKKYLIDYLVIVGAKRPDGSALQTPTLLNRYPKEERPSFPLPPDIVYFCQPEGCVNVCRRSSQSLHEDTTSFVFTLTEKDSGHTRYGVCVNFYRPFERRDLDKLRKNGWRKRRELRAQDEAAKLQGEEFSDDDESKIAEDSQSESKTRASARSESPRDLSDAAISDDNDKPVQARVSSPRRKWQRMIRTHSLTTLCIISRQPFVSGFRRCLLTLKRIVEASYHRTKRRNSRTPRYFNSIWAILSGNAHLSSTSLSGVISKEVEDIEDWIRKLLHAPVPVAGKSKVVLELLPADMQVALTFALPTKSRLSLLDFPFHLPFELLGVDLCLKVFTVILLEQKVVLRSRDYNALSMSVLSFTSMLYPLQYMFPVIPLLPVCLPGSEQLLLAPTPYIIGVPTPFFDDTFQLPNDVWLVDLDSNELLRPSACNLLPNLPEPEGTVLRSHLKQALESMSLSFSVESDAGPRVKGQEGSKSTDPLIYGNDVDSVDVAARVALVRFLLSPNVLMNLSDHTRTLRLYPRPVVAFQANSFMQSRPKPSEFTKGLSQTQAVEYFGEWSLTPETDSFVKISNNITDPTHIGDKAKWFSNQLQEIRHSAIDDATLFISTLADADEDNDSENCPTDESGSYDCEIGRSSTSCSSYSYDSEEETKGGEDLNANPISERTEEKFEAKELLQSVSLTCDTPGTRTASKDSSTSSASSNSEETVLEIERTAKQMATTPVERRSPFPSVKGPRRTLIDHRSVVRHTMAPTPQKTPNSNTLNNAENQQFLKDVAQNVINGKGVGWFNLKRTARLMECEDLRILLIQQVNRTIDLDANEDFFEHVEIGYRVYRGMSELLKCVVAGIEHSYKHLNGLGGLASALQLLEVAHTHYYCKQIKSDAICLEEECDVSPSENADDNSSLESTRNENLNSEREEQILKTIQNDASQDKSDSSSDVGSALPTELRFRSGKFVRVESTIEHDEERVYLAQTLLGKERSNLWDNMAFWEQMFLDAVALEREAIGMDQGPTDLIERYRSLVPHERRRLEEEEDQLLSTMLYNMMACMITMKVPTVEIKKKIRRLLGKSHVGLAHSGEINSLLEQIPELSSVCVDLKPCRSRHIKKQSFVVHFGTDNQATLLFMEVCDNAIILRTGSGQIAQRWWYEKIINITFCPKTQVLCLWRRVGPQSTALEQFYTTKCRELYRCINESMAARQPRLGGEFPVQDMKSGESALLQVTLDGVNLKFSGYQNFIPLNTIKKCNSVEDVFQMEQYKQDVDEVVSHKFKSGMASDIFYAVMFLIGYKVAGRKIQNNHR